MKNWTAWIITVLFVLFWIVAVYGLDILQLLCYN